MTTYGKAFVAALALLLAAVPGQAQGPTTDPPWGEDGPRLLFGPDDKGLVQLGYYGDLRFAGRDTGSGLGGDDRTTSIGFRRNRVQLRGAWGETVSFYVQSEFSENANVTTLGVTDSSDPSRFEMLDAVVRFDLHDSFKLSVGKFKYNLSRENLEACDEPLSLDRSLFVRAPFVATRDQGLAIWGNAFKDVFQYRLDVMEGRPAVNGLVAPSSGWRFGGRAHVSLLDPENAYGYRGTYLGKKKVLTIGGSFQFEPRVTYTDTVFRTGEQDYKAWTVDAFFEYPFASAGTVTASGAYEKVDLGGAYTGAHPDLGAIGLSGEKNGWYAKGGYMLPDLPLQVFGRFERWRFATLQNVTDQIVEWYGVGASYYVWGQHLKVTAELSNTRFDREGVFSGPEGTDLVSQDFHTFVTQIQFGF